MKDYEKMLTGKPLKIRVVCYKCMKVTEHEKHPKKDYYICTECSNKEGVV